MIAQIISEIKIRTVSCILSLIFVCFYFFQQLEDENFVEILIELINYDLNRNLFIETIPNQNLANNKITEIIKNNVTLLNYAELDLNENFLENNETSLQLLNKKIFLHFIAIFGITILVLQSYLFFMPSWYQQDQKKKKQLITIATLMTVLIYLDTIDTEYLKFLEQLLLEYNMNLNTEKTENILSLIITIEHMFYLNMLCFFNTFLLLCSAKSARLLYFFSIGYILVIIITNLEISIENTISLFFLFFYENQLYKMLITLRKVGFEPTIVINK